MWYTDVILRIIKENIPGEYIHTYTHTYIFIVFWGKSTIITCPRVAKLILGVMFKGNKYNHIQLKVTRELKKLEL